MAFVLWNFHTYVFNLVWRILGMVHHYYRPIIFNNKKLSKIIYFVYLVILIGMFVTVGYDSKYFSVAMILASLISMRLISYGTVDVNVKNETNFFGYVIKKFSDISYLVLFSTISCYIFNSVQWVRRI